MKKRIVRLGKSLHYASKGIHHSLMTQQNMLIHLAAGGGAFVLGVLLHFSYEKLAILVLTIALVIILEMVNTVAETLVDLVSPEFSELGRIVKDIAAGAVLLAAIFSIIIGVLLFVPPLVDLYFKYV